MSEFTQKVIAVIRAIPPGKVMSYGQIAVYVGAPRGARQVGRTMRHFENEQVPWWRVINNSGRITIQGSLYNDRHIQKKLLQSEGVHVTDEFRLDIETYRFIATEKQLKQFQLNETYITTVLRKYFTSD
jgi:methylated-DNA-protein-cysteine methyltransferase-like protein